MNLGRNTDETVGMPRCGAPDQVMLDETHKRSSGKPRLNSPMQSRSTCLSLLEHGTEPWARRGVDLAIPSPGGGGENSKRSLRRRLQLTCTCS